MGKRGLDPFRELTWLLTVGALAVLALTSGLQADDDPSPTIEELLRKLADPSVTAEDLIEVAQELATGDGEQIISALEKRLKREQDFHTVLALNYALAHQGRRSAVFPLIEALKETGHLGAVYLGWAFGYEASWDRTLWKQRVGEYTDASWAEFQRQRRLPRVPRDADLAGLRQASAWWDGLGLPDLGKTPFVRVGTGWIMSQGDEKWEAKQYGFLLREDTKSFTTLDTALHEIVWSKRSPPLSHHEAVPSYERIPIGATLGEEDRWDEKAGLPCPAVPVDRAAT